MSSLQKLDVDRIRLQGCTCYDSAMDALVKSVRQHNYSKLEYTADAAVLVPIIQNNENGLEMILTVRAGHLNSHAGEIAFPGGKVEPGDESLEDTALRESQEEIGLHPDNVELIGRIDQVVSKAGLCVQPVVGILHQQQTLQPNPDELDEIFTVPLQFFVDSEPVYRNYNISNQKFSMAEYQYGRYRVWGLTSRIIINLINIAYRRNIDHYKVLP